MMALVGSPAHMIKTSRHLFPGSKSIVMNHLIPYSTVERDRLESHRQKCNSRPKQKAEFHSEGINEAKQVADTLSLAKPIMSSWVQLLEFTRDNSLTLRDYPYNKQHDLSTGKAGRHDLQNVWLYSLSDN